MFSNAFFFFFTACPFGIINDDIYEQEEQFIISLKTDSKQVVIPANVSSAIVSVIDPEDSTYISVIIH